jgi:hypothetical protein
VENGPTSLFAAMIKLKEESMEDICHILENKVKKL